MSLCFFSHEQLKHTTQNESLHAIFSNITYGVVISSVGKRIPPQNTSAKLSCHFSTS